MELEDYQNDYKEVCILRRMKKKKRNLKKYFRPSMGLATFSVGTSLAGSALGGSLPAGTTNPLSTLGTQSSRFVSPVAQMGGIGLMTEQTGEIIKSTRKISKRRYK